MISPNLGEKQHTRRKKTEIKTGSEGNPPIANGFWEKPGLKQKTFGGKGT